MKTKLRWLEIAFVLAPFIAVAVVWRELPTRIPMHWNAAGAIDGWGSRSSILILPLISAATIALLRLLPRFDPKLRRSLREGDRMTSVLPILRVVFAGFFALIVAMQIAGAFGRSIFAGKAMMTAILILLAVLGNYLGNLRPNYFVGIRTPWTLESAETWRATHRLSGRLMFFGALILFALQFLLSPNLFAFVVVALILALTF